MKGFVGKQVLNGYRTRWIIVVISVLFFGGVFTVAGYKESKLMQSLESKLVALKAEPESEAGITYTDDYYETVANYDEVIAAAEQLIEPAAGQVKMYEEYYADSPYMKLDDKGVNITHIQFVVSDTENITEVCQGIAGYVTSGGLVSDLQQDDVDVTYLRELIGSDVYGNMLNVWMMHSDEAEAETLIPLIEKNINAYVEKYKKSYGDFKFEKLRTATRTEARSDVMSNQNNNINAIKNQRIALRDLKKAAQDQKTAKKNYTTQYVKDAEAAIAAEAAAAAAAGTETAEEEILKQIKSHGNMMTYMLVGFLIGFLLPNVIFIIMAVIDDRIKNVQILRQLGLTLLGGAPDDAADASQKVLSNCEYISAIAKQNGCDKVFFCAPAGGVFAEQGAYAEKLKEQGIEVLYGTDVQMEPREMQHLIAAGNCILLVEMRKTTATQLQDMRQTCENLHIPVWGAIAI